MKKGIIILSGGLDSTVLLHDIVAKKKYDIEAISFEYGQKHSREIECAAWQAKKVGVPHSIIQLPFINEVFSSALLQSGKSIPHGHYESETMKETVVPNRNMILLSIAAGVAISKKRNTIFYGAHSGDHAIYPDCREDFVHAMQRVFLLCDWEKIELEVPFLHLKKDDIVKKGKELQVDFSHTWTCYTGGEMPCEKCGSCVERAEAFAKNNLFDPLLQKNEYK